MDDYHNPTDRWRDSHPIVQLVMVPLTMLWMFGQALLIGAAVLLLVFALGWLFYTVTGWDGGPDTCAPVPGAGGSMDCM